jgi:hypothetical protein
MTVEDRLKKIETMLVILIERQTVSEWYSIEEFARIVGRSEFTCREWCRHARIRAEKKDSGRGAYASWVISHAELLRYQREGLFPLTSTAPPIRDSSRRIGHLIYSAKPDYSPIKPA